MLLAHENEKSNNEKVEILDCGGFAVAICGIGINPILSLRAELQKMAAKWALRDALGCWVQDNYEH